MSEPSNLPLLTAAEMQRWDRRAVEAMGVPERVLMESAGRAAAEVVQQLYPRGRVAAAVGRGKNGGDALVLLRTLRARGREVAAMMVGGASPDAQQLHGWSVPVMDGSLEATFAGAAVLVDGILGTGARGAPREEAAAAVRAMNASGVPIVALDGPTGVDLSTGAAPGEAIRAEVTVTFGAAKRGLVRFPGREHAGRVVVVEVGFPPIAPEERGAELVTPEWVAARLPRIPPDAHKGTAGAVTVVAGREGVAGASVMAVMGALRAGAGLVRVVAPEANRAIVQTAVPEALFVDRAGPLDEALSRADSILAGPGMGTDQESLALLRRVLQQESARFLLDADALTLLAHHPDLLPASAADRVVLTPHPGEMGRLLGRETAEIVADPFAAVEEGARRFGCTVLLKGAPSLVAAPDEPILANSTGTSGVATGGMGDTLAGVVSTFLGAGAAPRDAAALGVFLCGRAAEIAGLGRSLLPRDVAAALPLAIARPARADRLPVASVLFDLPAAE